MLNRKKKVVDESDQSALNGSLIVNALGRTCIVSEGNGAAQLLKHVQKTLQENLDMEDTRFEIYDRTGIILRSDQDLRDAIRAGKTPLHGIIPDAHSASEVELLSEKVGALKCEIDRQQQELKVETDQLRRDLNLSVASAKEEMRAEAEFAKRAEAAEVKWLKGELDNQRQEFRMAMDHLRHQLMLAVDASKKELHTEVVCANKMEAASLKCELGSQKQELIVTIDHLKAELTMSVESAKKDVRSEVELVKTKDALEVQHLEALSKDHLGQLQVDIQTVSKRLSEVAASVENASAGSTLCLSQHAEVLQSLTSLADQNNVFHARLANVEQSVHNSFLEQLKKDADLIPKSICEGETLVSAREMQPFQVWPGRTHSRQKRDNSSEASPSISSRSPMKSAISRRPREVPPARGNGSRSHSLSTPSEQPVFAPSRRISARSMSPTLDRLDARLPFTVVESPDRVECKPSSPHATVRTASPDDDTESFGMDSSRSSSPERGSGTDINSLRSSLQTLPSQAELIRVEEVRSSSQSVEPEIQSMVSYNSMVTVSMSTGQRLPMPSGDDEDRCSSGFQSPRMPFDPINQPACARSGALNPRFVPIQAATCNTDVVSSAASRRAPSSLSTGAASSIIRGTRQLQTRLELNQPEVQSVNPRGVAARVNAAFRSQSQPDTPAASPASLGSCCLASGQPNVSKPGQFRAQRMLGLSK